MLERLGRYQVLDRLGHGAMGTVYLGHDPGLQRDVALKVISNASSSDDLSARFRREAQAVARLSHPNIVSIYEFGETEAGEPFIAMELLRGETLQKAAVAQKLTLAGKLTVAAQVCDALSHAHSRGVIHRDIKPANILIEDTGVAKVTDFGIARLATGDLTQSGALVGTPQFMSPEQIAGREIDHRSDIFAVGTLIYWLVTGQHPFTGATVPEVLHRILDEQPLPLGNSSPVYGALQAIVDRALAKRADDRYKDAADMANDLRAVSRLVQPAGDTWPSGIAMAPPLLVAGLPNDEATELLAKKSPSAAQAIPPRAVDPLPNPKTDARVVEATSYVAPPTPQVVASGREPGTASGGTRRWTPRTLALPVVAAASLAIVAVVWFLGATPSREASTHTAPSASANASPTSTAPTPAQPQAPGAPPAPTVSAKSSAPPEPAPTKSLPAEPAVSKARGPSLPDADTVRIVVEGPANRLGAVRAAVSSRLAALGLRQVSDTAPARAQIDVTVQTSSVEEPVADAKVLRNQASVTVKVEDLVRHVVLGVRDSGVFTNTVQDEALGQSEALKRAVAAAMADDVFAGLTRQ